MSAIHCIYRKKELPISQRLGIISCLPKEDKPRQFLKNWRPITLLNVLYKMISGCISNRLKYILDSIISDTQSKAGTLEKIQGSSMICCITLNHTISPAY